MDKMLAKTVLSLKLLLLLSYVVNGADITDSAGNTVYDNGTISWGTVPGDSAEYKTNTSYSNGGLGMLFNFARSFVQTAAPKAFPLDLLADMMAGDFDIGSRYSEVIDYALGIGICIGIGVLYILLLPLCGCCFCCCRCCGKCGGNLHQKYNENDSCMRMGLGLCLFMVALCMVVSVGCVYVTNDRFGDSLDYIESSVHNNFDDIEIYLNNTVNQFLFLAVDMYGIVSSGITRDLNDMGSVIGEPLQQELLNLIDPTISSIKAMDTLVQSVVTEVNAVNASAMNLVSAADSLSTTLNGIAADIATTKTSCASDCTPSTACNAIDESIIAIGVDFSNFPDLSSTMSNLQDVASQNLTRLALQGRQIIVDLPETLNNKTANMRQSIQDQLDGFATMINQMVDGFIGQALGSFNVASTKDSITNYVSTAKSYETYRKYGGIGLMVFFSLVPCVYLLGILFGVIGHDKTAIPTERGKLSNCGGCCLMFGVVLIFITGFILMILSMISFAIGANLEKICEPLIDLTLFSEFLDSGGIPGFTFAGMLLGNSSVNLRLYDVILGCRADEAPYPLMKLKHIIPLEEYMDYEQYIGDVDEQLDSMAAGLDLTDMEILTPDTLTALGDFKSSGASTIDYAQFDSVLSNDVLAFDIDAMISAVSTVAGQCSGATQTSWQNIQSDLETVRDTNVPSIESEMAALNTSLDALKVTTDSIEPTVDNVISSANETQIGLQTQTLILVINSTKTFAERILNYVEQFKVKALDMADNDLATCLPVWNLYRSFTVITCNYLVDTLNGFWFTLGWGLLFGTPSVIIAVKLSKHYRRMNSCEDFGEDDEDDDIEGYLK